MPNIKDMESIPRRTLNIFYILDTSGSMDGAPISSLNRAMEETLQALKDSAKSNADAQLKIAVMEFNTNNRWMQPKGPEDAEDFIWENLTAAGLTNMGAALKELDQKLSREEYMKSVAGAFLPILIFMTDGYATDDYKKELDKVRKNKWFNQATKIGFALGEDPDVQMIADIVGNSEAVIRTSDLTLFSQLIRFASVTSSMMASTSHTTEEAASGAAVVKSIIQQQGVSAAIIPDSIQVDNSNDSGNAIDDWINSTDDGGWV